MYGMRLSLLTPELVDEILDTYGRVCEVPADTPFGKRKTNLWTGAWHLENIEKWIHRGFVEWRYGSGLPGKASDGEKHDTNAKLFVRRVRDVYGETHVDPDMIIKFTFDPNIVHGERAEKMKKDFTAAIDTLLTERGVGVPLEDH